MGEAYGFGALIAGIFLLVLAILWVCIPFAVFGIKPLLHTLISEQRLTREALERTLRVSEEHRPAPPPTPVEDNRTLGEIMDTERR